MLIIAQLELRRQLPQQGQGYLSLLLSDNHSTIKNSHVSFHAGPRRGLEIERTCICIAIADVERGIFFLSPQLRGRQICLIKLSEALFLLVFLLCSSWL